MSNSKNQFLLRNGRHELFRGELEFGQLRDKVVQAFESGIADSVIVEPVEKDAALGMEIIAVFPEDASRIPGCLLRFSSAESGVVAPSTSKETGVLVESCIYGSDGWVAENCIHQWSSIESLLTNYLESPRSLPQSHWIEYSEVFRSEPVEQSGVSRD